MENNMNFIKTKAKDKRFITVLLLVISFLALFGPFAKLSVSSSLTVPITNNVLKTDNYTIGSLSLGGFATFRNIGDTQVGDKPLKSYNVFGVNVYDTLKNPPTLGGRVDKLVNALNPSTLEYLKSPELNKLLTSRVPDAGATIFDITSTVGDSLLTLRAFAETLQPFMSDLDNVLSQTASALNTAEGLKTVANLIVFIAFVLILIAIYLFCSPKKGLVVPRILTALSFFILASIAFVVPIISYQMNMVTGEISNQLNLSINNQIISIINSIYGDKASFLTVLFGGNANYFSFNLHVSLQWGAILMLITMIAAFITSFYIEHDSIEATTNDDALENNNAYDDLILDAPTTNTVSEYSSEIDEDSIIEDLDEVDEEDK